MLKVENLHTTVGDKEILEGISLPINAGEIPAITTQNPSMTSTPSMHSGEGRSSGSDPHGSGLRRSTGEDGTSAALFAHLPHARAAA